MADKRLPLDLDSASSFAHTAQRTRQSVVPQTSVSIASGLASPSKDLLSRHNPFKKGRQSVLNRSNSGTAKSKETFRFQPGNSAPAGPHERKTVDPGADLGPEDFSYSARHPRATVDLSSGSPPGAASDGLRERVQQLESERSEFARKREAAAKEKELLLPQLAAAEEKLAELQKRRDVAEKELSVLRLKEEKWEQERAGVQAELLQSQESDAKMRGSIEWLTKRLHDSEKLSSAAEDRKNAEDEKTRLDAMAQERRERRAALMHRLEKESQTIPIEKTETQWGHKLDALLGMEEKLRLSLAAYANAQGKAKVELAQTAKGKAAAERELGLTRETLKKQLEELLEVRSAGDRLRKSQETLSGELSGSEARQKLLKERVAQLRRSAEELERENAKSQAELDAGKEAVEAARMETTAEFARERGQRQAEIDTLAEELSAATKNRETLEGESAGMRQDIRGAEARDADVLNIKRQLEAAKSGLESALLEKEELQHRQQEKLAKRDAKISELSKKQEQMRSTIDSLNSEIQASAQRRGKLEEDLEAAQTEISALAEDTSSPTENAELETLAGKLIEAEAAANKAKEERVAAETKRDEVQSQFETLDEEVKDLKFSKAKVERDSQLLEKKARKREAEMAALGEECEGLKKRIDAGEKAKIQLKKELAEQAGKLKAKAVEEDERIKAQDAELLHNKATLEESAKRTAALRAELEQANNELLDLNKVQKWTRIG